jgi:hypothetical protein
MSLPALLPVTRLAKEKSMQKQTLIGGLLALATIVSLPAHAEETVCNSTIGAVALDNVFVPDGARCVLERTRTNGNVVVGRGAVLIARGVSVNGNIQAEGAASVRVVGASTVGGAIQIVQGGGALIRRTRVNGDILVDANNAPLTLDTNNVGGNVQAFQNTGGIDLTNNTIKGNLQCKENSPPPTGGGNSASSKEDQCAAL